MSEPTHPRVVWDAESAYPELIAKLREELRSIKDPEIGLSVIELGLVRNVWLEETKAHIYMIMTTPFCPYASALLETARQRGEKILERPTTIEMGFEPWEPSMMEEGAGAEWGLF